MATKQSSLSCRIEDVVDSQIKYLLNRLQNYDQWYRCHGIRHPQEIVSKHERNGSLFAIAFWFWINLPKWP